MSRVLECFCILDIRQCGLTLKRVPWNSLPQPTADRIKFPAPTFSTVETSDYTSVRRFFASGDIQSRFSHDSRQSMVCKRRWLSLCEAQAMPYWGPDAESRYLTRTTSLPISL